MQALPAIIAAVGTAATIHGQNRMEKKQRAMLNQQLEREDQASDKSAEMVKQEGQNYSQEARLQGMVDAEQKTYEQTQADLQGAGGATVATSASTANVSDDFLKTKAARAIEEGTRLTSIARETAKARAPGRMHQDDSLRMASLAGDLQNLWGGTQNMARANGLDVQSVKMPAYGQMGKIATAVGSSMASSGYGQGGGGGINFGGG